MPKASDTEIQGLIDLLNSGDARASEPDDIAAWGDFHDEVEKLPEELREVFNLLYYDGMTQQEAADVLGVGLSTVKRRWQEARIQLHDRLGGTS